jgi:LPS sulfotransferase NodH
VSATRAWGVRARARGYLLCATPRSGSNYLCELLASTGRLGTPREYFNATGRRAYDDPAYPEDPRQQLAQVLTTGSTTNRVYGVKVHPFQLAPLLDRVDPFAHLPRLRAVRIRRLDRLGQALSWARAQQTGQFRAGDRASREPAYSRDLVDRARQFLEEEDASWARVLAAQGLTALELTYEDLVQDPQRQVDRVAALMRLRGRPAVDPAQVTVRVQRDAATDEWRARYLAGD